jgi:acetyl esterase/lipase
LRPALRLSGPAAYRAGGLAALAGAVGATAAGRARRGPLAPGWPFEVEVATLFLRAQLRTAFGLPRMAGRRAYLDAVMFEPPVVGTVRWEAVEAGAGGAPVSRRWVRPAGAVAGRTLLYLHGGGYAFRSCGLDGLIAMMARAARAETFVPHYRLAPEHRFPAQLEDARAAYGWLMAMGRAPGRLAVAGDSAEGNLVLGLLLALRDAGVPLPALGVGLCPWTDLAARADGTLANDRFDWMQGWHADPFVAWLTGGDGPLDPRLSRARADLRGLPPLYVQAGGREVLVELIRAFVAAAREQGVVVGYDEWPTMNHDFQAFGEIVPEARTALRRIGEEVERHVGG